MTPTAIDQEFAAAIGEHYAAIRARVAAAAARGKRPAETVRIVAVTKGFGPDAVLAAYAAGLRDFGENRVQEAEGKYAPIRAELAGARLHLIGHLQSNKARRAVELVDVIETVDDARLAVRLARLAEERGRPLDVLLQVNVSGAESQEGAPPEAVEALLRETLSHSTLHPIGLMTIGTNGADEPRLRRDFGLLRGLRDDLRQRLNLPDFAELSMGMSGDFEIAIEEGATAVRLGRGLFGNRPATYVPRED